MSILSVPSRNPLKNNSHHGLLLGNAMVYLTNVHLWLLLICTISEELLIMQAVDDNQFILFTTVMIVSESLRLATLV